MDGGFFWLVLEIGFVRCGLGCGKLLLAGAGGLEMVPMVLLLQPLWLRRTGLRRILVWRGLAVVLLGLSFAVSSLRVACCMVLVLWRGYGLYKPRVKGVRINLLCYRFTLHVWVI